MATCKATYFDREKRTYTGTLPDFKNAVKSYLQVWMQKGDYICWFNNGGGNYFAVVCNRNGDDTDASCIVQIKE